MGDQPTLLFCVGATKAGTSWLFDYLKHHPECHLRSVKELQYFYAHEQNRAWCRQDIKVKIAEFKKTAGDGPVVRGDPRRVKLNDLRELAKLLRGPVDDDAYIAYLTRGMAGQKLVADISPSYSLMSTARLAEMAQILPDVRFVFILRDPVQRLWSNVRMMARPKAGAEMAAAAGKILDRAVLGDAPEIEMRSDYCGALQRLGAAVAPKKLKIVFYEDLMTEAGISGLCSFLGLTSLPGDLGRRVHEGAKLAMTGAQKRAAAAWLAPQYDYVNERMGRLPQAWHETLAEAA